MFTVSCPQRVPGEMFSMKLDCSNSLYLSKVTLKLSAVCSLMRNDQKNESLTPITDWLFYLMIRLRAIS